MPDCWVGLLNNHPVNVLPFLVWALTGVRMSEPYVAVPALFAVISAASVSPQLIVIVLASHIAGPGAPSDPNTAARNARELLVAYFKASAQLYAQLVAQL